MTESGTKLGSAPIKRTDYKRYTCFKFFKAEMWGNFVRKTRCINVPFCPVIFYEMGAILRWLDFFKHYYWVGLSVSVEQILNCSNHQHWEKHRNRASAPLNVSEVLSTWAGSKLRAKLMNLPCIETLRLWTLELGMEIEGYLLLPFYSFKNWVTYWE